MKAVRVHQFGGPEVLRYEDLPTPVPAADEVLVRVEAAGVGPWDAWIRSGHSALPQPLPLTLGSDLAGVVESVGSSIVELRAGDDVYGVTNPQFTGAYAQWAVAAASMLARKPKRLSFIEAASVPVVAVTAWQMLFEHAKMQPGQRILVLGASGNVGSMAVQLAHQHGAHTIAAITSDDAARMRQLGADEVLDFRNVAQVQGLGLVDSVIDAAGGESQRLAITKLKRRGIIISAVSAPDAALLDAQGAVGSFFLVRTTTKCLQQLTQLIDTGKLSTRVGEVLPLHQARTAHEMLDGLRTYARGKIVLTTRADPRTGG
jgi:NADPH:quinone reductase-like Zn-dependent oxidoreductase